MYEVITQTQMFKNVPVDRLEELFSKLRYQRKVYNKEDLIMYAGDEYNNLLILLSGSVRCESSEDNGKYINVENILQGNSIACAYLFDTNSLIPFDIIANNKCEVLQISKQDVIELLQKDKLVLQNYLNAITSKINFLTNRLICMSLKTIRGKIAKYILELAEGYEQTSFKFPHTQQQMADFFGVTRPAFARELALMEKKGLIKFANKKVSIVDNRGLQELLSQ
jgi:CRP-like cAMP-binding protein